MTTNQQNIEEKIEKNTPALSADEKRALWSKINTAVLQKSVPSPFFISFIKTRAAVPAVLALVFLLGTAGTVAASGKARPGDLLFPIDQAVEGVRLAFAGDDIARVELKRQFAEERMEELRSLLAEDQAKVVTTAATTTVSAEMSLEVEADVFTDITIVKVEIDDRKSVFETTANTRESVVDEILSRFTIDRARVEDVLVFTIEDRKSRVSEHVATDSDTRVSSSLQLLDTLLTDLSDIERSRIISEVVNEFTTAGRVRIDGNDVRIKIKNEGDDSRTEVRNDGERIRIREKDGEVRIDVKEEPSSSDDDTEMEEVEDDGDEHSSFDDEDEQEGVEDDSFDDDYYDDEDEDEWEDEDDERGSDDSNGLVRVEVRVEKGTAEVRVDYGRNSEEFETVYVSKTALIATIALRTGLSESAVARALDLEVKE